MTTEGFSTPSLLGVIVLIVLNGFFVAAEYSLVSVRRTRIQELADDGSKRAILVKHAIEDINKYVSTAQIGVTVCSLLIGFLGEPVIASIIEKPLELVGIEGHALSVV